MGHRSNPLARAESECTGGSGEGHQGEPWGSRRVVTGSPFETSSIYEKKSRHGFPVVAGFLTRCQFGKSKEW